MMRCTYCSYSWMTGCSNVGTMRRRVWSQVPRSRQHALCTPHNDKRSRRVSLYRCETKWKTGNSGRPARSVCVPCTVHLILYTSPLMYFVTSCCWTVHAGNKITKKMNFSRAKERSRHVHTLRCDRCLQCSHCYTRPYGSGVTALLSWQF